MALALLAGGCTSGPAADTRGYRLKPPPSVDEYKKRTFWPDASYVGKIDCAGQPSDADCYQGATEVRGIGISPADANRIVKHASGTGNYYSWGPEGEPGTKGLLFRGLWGEIPDPGEAVDRFLRSIKKGEQLPFSGITITGQTKEFDLDGFDGALMRCQEPKKTGDNAPKTLCVWADHSTVAGVSASQISLSELADLTSRLYKTSRVKK
jgi:hypothetical protein